MSSRNERQSWVLRFCDTFLQEQSIKWMLAVGMLILLGSSLMLVTSHWDSYTPVWKLLVLVGYTAGLHVAGQVTYRSLGLLRTGTGLMSLTVLLIPLPFYSLRWVAPELAGSLEAWGHHAGVTAILCLSTVFAVIASGQIFRHFLRRPEYIFTAAYVVLSVAGAVIPGLPSGAAPLLALALWSVFAIGSMRVNRHIFWLTADHRWPRVCAFFPILLLGSQFLILFASSLAPGVPIEWLGFGTVLTALPMLFAAEQHAKVFQCRVAETSRSQAWSTALPLFAGLVMTMAGVCLAATEFPQGVALVPTAALAAVVMYQVARRTGRVGCVWPMMILTAVAYQSSPVFFREFAGQIIQQSAHAVQESRLPIAFYGLTYLPLLMTFSLCSVFRRRADDDLLAVPLRQFSIAVAGVLMLVSLLHVKAVFPVSIALSGLFALQSGLFRSRNVLRLGVVAWIVAAAGFTPFAESVLGMPAATELPRLAMAVAAAVLCLPGCWLDRRAAAWESGTRTPPAWDALPACQTGGLLVLLASAAVWLALSVWHGGVTDAPVTGILLTSLLLVQAVQWRKPWLADIALASLIVCPAILLLTGGTGVALVVTLAASMLAGLWLMARVLQRYRHLALVETFADSADRVVLGGFVTVLAISLVPGWGLTLLGGAGFPLLVSSILATTWALADAARRRTGLLARLLSVIGWIGLLATLGAAAIDEFSLESVRPWLPAAWAMLSVACIPLLRCYSTAMRSVNHAASDKSASVALSRCVLITLGLTAVASLWMFSTPMRVAGLVSLGGLMLLAGLWRYAAMRTVALMLVSWQLLCAVIQVFAPHLRQLGDLTVTSFAAAAIPFALLAALQALGWQIAMRRAGGSADLSNVQRIALLVAAGASLLCSLTQLVEGLHFSEILLAGGVFLVLAADRVLAAIHLSGCPTDRTSVLPRDSGIVHVWLAIGILAAGFAYLVLFDAISFTRGLGKFAVLLVAVGAWIGSRLTARSSTLRVLSQPLGMTAMWLPAVTVVMGVVRHFAGPAPVWLGLNSLSLLLAGGFYFWRGLEERHRGLLVSSAITVNVALALLWDELQWSDPQFFMVPLGASILGLVELLRADIPQRMHNPLRYAGALTILVSPTFHIVGGSWLHLLTLMVAAVTITLLAIGLRVRALMYAGTAFLVADVAAMVVRGSIDHPGLLWLAGIVLGTLVISLAAVCERHREQLQQRIRVLTAELEAWR